LQKQGKGATTKIANHDHSHGEGLEKCEASGKFMANVIPQFLGAFLKPKKQIKTLGKRTPKWQVLLGKSVASALPKRQT